MITFLTFRLPNGGMAKLCFTRMSKDDSWVCQMPEETLTDIQHMLGQDFYESI
jgi:hypothetical protein